MSATTVESNGNTVFTNALYTINSSPEYIILGEGWTDISDNAFIGTGLKEIYISKSVTNIGDTAFENATSLESAVFAPDSNLTSIGKEVFYGTTSLTSIVIPSNVTSIGKNVFQQSGLNTVYMRQFTVDAMNNLNVLNPEYTIISFGSGKTFYGKVRPTTDFWDPDALAISGFSREEHLTFDDPFLFYLLLNYA